MNICEQFWRAPYNHLIKKLNICNIPLLESEEYDILWILSMYSLLRVSLYKFQSYDEICQSKLRNMKVKSACTF